MGFWYMNELKTTTTQPILECSLLTQEGALSIRSPSLHLPRHPQIEHSSTLCLIGLPARGHLTEMELCTLYGLRLSRVTLRVYHGVAPFTTLYQPTKLLLYSLDDEQVENSLCFVLVCLFETGSFYVSLTLPELPLFNPRYPQTHSNSPASTYRVLRLEAYNTFLLRTYYE